MWGSYLGAILLAFSPIFCTPLGCGNTGRPLALNLIYNFSGVIFIFVMFYIITGFLIGWGINSIYRKLKG